MVQQTTTEEAFEMNQQRSVFDKIFNPVSSRTVDEKLLRKLLDPDVSNPMEDVDKRDFLKIMSDPNLYSQYKAAEEERAYKRRQADSNSIRNTTFDFLNKNLGINPRTAEMLTSATDWTPLIGDATAIEDAVDAYREGKIGEAVFQTAMAGIGIAPFIGDAIAKSVRTMVDKSKVVDLTAFKKQKEADDIAFNLKARDDFEKNIITQEERDELRYIATVRGNEMRKDVNGILYVDNPRMHTGENYGEYYQEAVRERVAEMRDSGELKDILETYNIEEEDYFPSFLFKQTGYIKKGSSGVSGGDTIPFHPRELIDFPGVLGEQNFRTTDSKLTNLIDRIRTEGYNPTPIQIVIREDGKPFIYEGNHRLAEAYLTGRPRIDAHISYIRGAERADGPLSPERLGLVQRGYLNTNVMPISEARLVERGFEYQKGGRFIDPATKEDLTNINVSEARITVKPEMEVAGPRPQAEFRVSGKGAEKIGGEGTKIKTNIIKPTKLGNKAGWSWINRNDEIPDVNTLVSVSRSEKGKDKHYFALETDFSKGAKLATYPEALTEPRLRPTTTGKLKFGNKIGEIKLRGEVRPVYDRITTFAKGGLMSRSI